MTKGASRWRFIVIVGDAAHGDAALRIEDPALLLRLWSLLQATSDQLDSATLSPEVIRRELERAVSRTLDAELRRVLPSHDAIPGAGALRIECAMLVSWVGSLVVRLLGAIATATVSSPSRSG